jgi:hypothetical protein
MGSPIFDSTFGTGRFRYEEATKSPEPQDVWQALEVKELEAALAQSDAEPVAWQYRVKQGGWGGWHEAQTSREEAELCVSIARKLSGGHIDDYEIRPLYTPINPPSLEITHERMAED